MLNDLEFVIVGNGLLKRKQLTVSQ